MSTKTEEHIKIGGYTFKIIENSMEYNNTIFSRTFKIGGDYEDCVNLSYTYSNGKPQTAKLPHLMYEPECAIGKELQRGGGSELMIKTLIKYAHKKIPEVNIFEFDDMSNIDCVEKDVSKPPPRKPIRPLKLSYFSIAYNGLTWYEKHFNAKMKDLDKYTKYRERIHFLTDTISKVEFVRFLEIAKPPLSQIEQLKLWYESAKTYREFFNLIPFEDRCNILFSWLDNFMSYYLHDVFTDRYWYIDVRDMDLKKGGKRQTRKRLYPSKYKLIHYESIHSF
jgi:hypothetical protein